MIIDQTKDALHIALEAIAGDAREGFAGSRHEMRFPASEGFQRSAELQISDIFPRAVALETLAFAQSCGLNIDRTMLTQSVQHLIDSRRRRGAGGWAYFPALIELAPDADTLAQVAIALASLHQWGPLDEFVVPQIDRLEKSVDGGHFETWLYDTDPAICDLQRHFAEHAWGTGTDAEVVSNVVRAARQISPERWKWLIACGQDVLLDACDDGWWRSTWYHGPYYGTYVAVCALLGLPQSAPLLSRTAVQLCAAQRRDGGWGESERSDPLSTALALLALAQLTGDHAAAACERGIRYLQARALEGDLVRAIPFIKMNLGRARGDDGPILSFASSTITAAFVLRAVLFCWRRYAFS